MLQTAGLILIAGPVMMAGFAAVLVAVNAPRTFLTIALVAIAFLEWRPIVALNTVNQLGFYLGSIRVAPGDVLALVAIAATAWLLMRNTRRFRPSAPATLLTVCVIVAVGFAIMGLGIQDAVVYWRTWFYSLAFLWWAHAAFRRLPEFPTAPFVIGGLTAALLFCIEVVRNGIGAADVNIVDANGNVLSSRPVSASLALMGLFAIVAILGSDWRWSPRGLACLAALGLFVVFAQHRSVWTAAIAAGVSAAAMHWSRARDKTSGIALAVLGAVLILMVSSTLLESVSELAQSATSTGTWNGRLAMWGESLSSVQGTGRIIVGQMLGPLDAIDFELAYPRGISVHNMLLETFLRLGIVGVVLLAWLVIQVVQRSSLSVRAIVLPCTLALMVYGISYAWPPWTWAVLGIALATPARNSERPRTSNRGTRKSQPGDASETTRFRSHAQDTSVAT